MSINVAPNSNVQPNFRGHYVVQVAKKAFKNPEDYRQCSKLFDAAMCEQTGDKLKGLFGAMVAIFTTKPHKSMSFLEKPSLFCGEKAAKKIGHSLSWLREKTGLQIADVANPNYHTFDVYTKNEKDKVTKILRSTINPKNDINLVKEGFEKYKDGDLASAYATVKKGVNADKAIKEALQDVPAQEFKIETLDDLKNVVKNMEY